MGFGKAHDGHLNYNGFMQLVREWSNVKAAYEVAKASKEYNLRKENRLSREADVLFNRICDEASRRFPGGRGYDSLHSANKIPARMHDR